MNNGRESQIKNLLVKPPGFEAKNNILYSTNQQPINLVQSNIDKNG